MISIQNLHKRFGGILAVNDASFTIDTGSITGLIGPNGAGKTTLFNIIAGVYHPDSGTVLLDGEDITGLPPHQLFTKGLLRTFQIAHEFSSLTVKEGISHIHLLFGCAAKLPSSNAIMWAHLCSCGISE